MPELTREDLYSALQPLQANLAAVKNDLAAMKSDVATVKNDLAATKSDVAAVKNELAGVRIRVDGLPLIGAAIDALQRDSCLLRAAINDMPRTHITAGEV